MLSHLAATVAFLCPISLAQSSAEPTLPAAEYTDLQYVASSAQPQSGVRAGFWWADYDRDGLDDAFVVGAGGAARLLRNSGDGSFADVTMISGLDGLGAASFAAWQDFDRDGAPDVFVGTQSGPGHLMRNAGDGTFQDVTQFVGLNHSGRHLAAQWFDYDLDGLSDLSVRTDSGEHLYHALPNGHFELVDLGSVQPRPIISLPADAADLNTDLGADVSVHLDSDKVEGRRAAIRPWNGLTGAPAAPTRSALPPAPPPGTYLISACPPRIEDTNVGGCLQASSVATLGMLFPLTIDLNVSGGGNVGIGTTTPAAKLEVAGTARITDTLTLNPSGDQALNISSGSIYKNGLLFAHTKSGTSNTAIGLEALASGFGGGYNTATGRRALFSNQYGYFNTANGNRALFANTSGSYNMASGNRALYSNTTGGSNTASGAYALSSNTTGYRNTASGRSALFSLTTGTFNTASGNKALYSNTTGARNTASGSYALSSNTTGAQNTASGTNALLSNMTGSFNTASGSTALLLNTTGDRNTANGYGALRSNTTGTLNTGSGNRALTSNTSGSSNSANGNAALAGNTTGSFNTASGSGALSSNSSGSRNTASGYVALFDNTTGSLNTASGTLALRSNTTGTQNTASGYGALRNNTAGNSNTASGNGALYSNTTGNGNIALGAGAGSNTTGSYNISISSLGVAGEDRTIRIGLLGIQTRTFVLGIRGVTTVNANAIPVLVDSAGQLGTVSSSRRFKKDIVDMGGATSRLLELRPVRFRYKQEQTLPDGSEVPMEYGLIAEEVAEIFPDLVVYDDEGKPFTVKYHILSSMLLNEMKKQASEIARLQGLEERLAAVEARTNPPASSMVGATGIR